MCLICETKFRFKFEVYKHVKLHHSEIESGTQVTTICFLDEETVIKSEPGDSTNDIANPLIQGKTIIIESEFLSF